MKTLKEIAKLTGKEYSTITVLVKKGCFPKELVIDPVPLSERVYKTQRIGFDDKIIDYLNKNRFTWSKGWLGSKK